MILKNYNLVFDEKEHKYSLYHKETGEFYKDLLSTTQLMSKHGLSVDYSDVPPEILETARLFGDIQHAYLEQYFKGVRTIDEVDVVAREGIELFEKKGFIPFGSEFKVNNFDYAGTIDMLAMKDDELALIDYKFTYNFNHSSIRWQLNIYRRLLRECLHYEVKKLYSLWYNKQNKKFEMREISLMEDSLIEELFLADRKGEIFTDKQTDYMAIIEKDLKLDQEFIKYFVSKNYFETIEIQFEIFKKTVEEEMEQLGITSYETDKFKITRVLPTETRAGHLRIVEKGK